MKIKKIFGLALIALAFLLAATVKADSTSSLLASLFGSKDTVQETPQVLGVETATTTETESILPSQKLSIKDKTLK
ncbi:MAG: hypothetical protein Q8L09_01335, partial [Candidatus Moranbacteria bacterium]|nr:hypothetical protein [Candidatus Moranbacteria bacterium]